MAIALTLTLTFLCFVTVGAARIVLTLYALELGAPAAVAGVLGGMFFVFPLLLSWPIGAFADRYGARGPLLIGAASGIGAMTLPYFVHTIPAFYISAALCGPLLACFHVTLQNLMGIMGKAAERARNLSNFSLVGAITNFFGPLFAGFSIDHAGHAVACLYIAALPVTAMVLLLIWSRLFPPGNPDAAHGTSAIKTLADREVWRMLGTSGLVQLGTDLFQFYLPIYGHAIGLSASAIGAILASFAIASFVVRLFLVRLIKHVTLEKLLAWSFFMGAAGYMLVPFFNHAVMLAVVAFIFGLGMGLGIPLTVIAMFSHSAEGRSGQTLGLRLTTNNFVRLTGPIIFGAIGSAFGLPPVFWINAALMAYGSVLSRSRAKQARR